MDLLIAHAVIISNYQQREEAKEEEEIIIKIKVGDGENFQQGFLFF